MLKEAQQAADGLQLGDIAEIRSLSVAAAPPIVQLVARCVATLVAADGVAADSPRSRSPSPPRSPPTSAREPPLSARKRQQASMERLASAKSPRSPPASTPRTPITSARGEASEPHSELLSWSATLKLFNNADFKSRLLTINGCSLLDRSDLIDAVHNVLDLSTMDGRKKIAILPGRGHAGDRVEENKARRELTTLLYSSHADAGVNLHPLRFEEARYVNEVIGAMLIWIHRIFLQHNVLVRDRRTLYAALDAAERQAELSAKIMEQQKAVVNALQEERSSILAREASMVIVSKPTELTTVDKVGSTVMSRPNIVFINGRISGRGNDNGRQTVVWDLPARLRLPSRIFFYLRVKHVSVSFPLPPREADKLLEARVVAGHEEDGPVAFVPFDPSHVIGLREQDLLSFSQLVVEVPSTPTVNPTLVATRMNFHPAHATQLHDQSKQMPRVNVAVFARGGVRSSEGARPASPRARTPRREEDVRKEMEREREMELLTEFAASEFLRCVGEAPPEAARPTATAASAPYVPQLAIPSRHGPIGSPFNAEALHMRHGLTTERDKARQARAELLVAKVKAGYALLPEELGRMQRLAAEDQAYLDVAARWSCRGR